MILFTCLNLFVSNCVLKYKYIEISHLPEDRKFLELLKGKITSKMTMRQIIIISQKSYIEASGKYLKHEKNPYVFSVKATTM